MMVRAGVVYGPYEPAELVECPEAEGEEGEGAGSGLPHHTVV